MTADDVLRWGHARYRARVRRGLPVPSYVAALEREYNRRRKALARVRDRVCPACTGAAEDVQEALL